MLKGIWQLKKLILFYTKGGSSRGVRELVEQKKTIQTFMEKNPQVDVSIKEGRAITKHPYVRGEYLCGSRKVICVKNKSPKDILMDMDFLRNQSGLPKAKTWTRRQTTRKKSIQGPWNPFTIYADIPSENKEKN